MNFLMCHCRSQISEIFHICYGFISYILSFVFVLNSVTTRTYTDYVYPAFISKSTALLNINRFMFYLQFYVFAHLLQISLQIHQ